MSKDAVEQLVEIAMERGREEERNLSTARERVLRGALELFADESNWRYMGGGDDYAIDWQGPDDKPHSFAAAALSATPAPDERVAESWGFDSFGGRVLHCVPGDGTKAVCGASVILLPPKGTEGNYGKCKECVAAMGVGSGAVEEGEDGKKR